MEASVDAAYPVLVHCWRHRFGAWWMCAMLPCSCVPPQGDLKVALHGIEGLLELALVTADGQGYVLHQGGLDGGLLGRSRNRACGGKLVERVVEDLPMLGTSARVELLVDHGAAGRRGVRRREDQAHRL